MNSSTGNKSRVVYLTSGDLIDKVNDGFFSDIFVPSFVYTIIMMLVCCPGNLFVFYIYFARWRKTTSRVFIISLALFDLVNGFVTTPTELAFMWNIFRWKNATICKCSRFLTIMMNNGSSITLVGIAIDRYLRICKPLRSPMSTKTAKIWVFVSCFIAVVFAWPALVIYGLRTIRYPILNKSVVAVGSTCQTEDFFVKTKYPLVFTIVLLSGNILIDIVLITLYTLIAIQVLKRGSFDRNRDSSHRKNMRKASTSVSTSEDGVIDSNNSSTENKGESVLRRFSKVFRGSVNESDSHKKNYNQKTLYSPATRKHNFLQRSISVQSEEARRVRMIKTTVMLFLVTLLFMVSFIPYCVIVIYNYTFPNYYLSLSTKGKGVYQFFLRSYLLSMSLNPIIYSFMNEQFRKECKYGFRKLRCWKKN